VKTVFASGGSAVLALSCLFREAATPHLAGNAHARLKATNVAAMASFAKTWPGIFEYLSITQLNIGISWECCLGATLP
jgi:hypothetical protein